MIAVTFFVRRRQTLSRPTGLGNFPEIFDLGQVSWQFTKLIYVCDYFFGASVRAG
jgi:hypothetical protein